MPEEIKVKASVEGISGFGYIFWGLLIFTLMLAAHMAESRKVELIKLKCQHPEAYNCQMTISEYEGKK